ncbi:peptide chain release factor N(5)-glutamine methyltransferase [Aureivirga marina]|uniref:peptide chain release factor N(5)-glutamine methyltransferase n=1 Tax=Aureivirga marina TaxID=1182451 RepID=UPI0018CA81E4|nr:peptide chain release factor N(5)-glutamine methyltransferase [Aureivirga marina]
MEISVFKKYFFDELKSVYPETEIQSFFYLLTEHFLQLRRIDIALEPNFEISEEKLDVLKQSIDKLKTEFPIQYIIEETSFFGLDFFVNKNTLIPRPETEELVQWILDDFQNSMKKLKILDIGTGTGCIPISLAKNLPNAEIHAYDISEEALKIAKKNAERNKVTIHFQKINILETEKLDADFDIIISNPPYVRNLEKVEIKKNVLDYEPHLALFVSDNDPLIFYRKIAELAKYNLKENGFLYYEINQYLGKETIELVEKLGFKNVELRKDIFQNDRILKAEKN